MQNNIGRGPRSFGWQRGIRPVVKAKNFTATLFRLWKFFGTERKLLALVFIFVFISSLITLLAPFIIGRSIDAMTQGKNTVHFEILQNLVLILFVAYIVDAFIGFLQSWTISGVSQRIVKNIRSNLFEKLQKLPISYFDINTHGDLMSRLSNDVDNISTTISQSTAGLMSSVLNVLGALIMMLILSPVLTLASIITIPLVFFLTKTVTRNTKELFKKQQEILGKLNGHIEEGISGLYVVKAFNCEENSIEQFENLNASLRVIGTKAQIWSGYIMPLMNVINNIGFVAVAWVGGILAVNKLITIGIIASFLSYSRQFTRPLNEIANTYNTLQTAIAGAERVFEVLDENEEQHDIEGALELSGLEGHVVFEDVSFEYRSDVPVLKNISFEASMGSNTAIVGPTGAGKTTIVNLLTRFYDVTNGKIFIDGHDIREYSKDSLRRCFGVVLQDTYLFSGTIRDNIRYGRPEASDFDIEKAASIANVDTFVSHLPNGYYTELTESGSNLSQGQRQLIAIARAVLANPSILILDEATSSVVTRTELHNQEAMANLMRGRTSFIIAHRLSTIRDADTIMVVINGEIAEKGNHKSLIHKNGVYHELYSSQYKNIENT